ncbi:MAG TPA: metal-dependent hydrolase [Steroidobacteraceae bacterium]|nr:metal-dependent hydrolase [Steroidobacteraceae bacterium]
MGEAVARRARPPLAPSQPAHAALPEGTFRRLIVVSLAVASNLPDVDVLYTSFDGGPLTYILQHRGYTHTVPGALVCAALLWFGCLLWMRLRRLQATPRERAWLAAAALAGVLLHLAMDYTNNYGVHPFWPFYDGWVYGDSVYIVEPLLWLAAAPLIFVLETRTARSLVAVALAVATLAVVAFNLVPTPLSLAFVVLGAAMLAAGRWLRPAAALGCGLVLWLAVTAVFVIAGRVAAGRLQAAAMVQFPEGRTLDRVLTPMPADPVCWDAWLVQARAGTEVMRQAHISLLPGMIAVGRCRGVDLGPAKAVPQAPAPAAAPGIEWRGEFTLPADRIATLAATHCRARAFMQFARVPMATAGDTGWWLADLRFGAGRGRGFAQLHLLGVPQPCDFASVPWLAPRPELLAPAAAAGTRSR